MAVLLPAAGVLDSPDDFAVVETDEFRQRRAWCPGRDYSNAVSSSHLTLLQLAARTPSRSGALTPAALLALTARVAPTLTRASAEISTGIDTDLRKVAWK